MSPLPSQSPDPDVVQAIADFRFVARRIRNHSDRLIRATNPQERASLQRQVDDDMTALEIRAQRIGGGLTGGGLLLLINDDDHARAGRVARPTRESARVHLDRVQAAVAHEAAMKMEVRAANIRWADATRAREDAEAAARAYGVRGAA